MHTWVIAVAVGLFLTRDVMAQHAPSGANYESRTVVRYTPPDEWMADVRCALPTSTPAAAGLRPAAVDSLVRLAGAAGSDALVILKDGKRVGEWYFGRPQEPIELMSVTKVVAGMAVARLLHEGKLASLDEPLATFFPEWRQGRKAGITLRHVLTHTTGLQNVQNSGLEIEPSPDVVRLGLAAELDAEPGAHWSYNNKAINLLAGAVESAAGMSLDRYLRSTVFDALCITEFGWMYDPSGNPFAMAGARLHARDLAKLGQLMLQRGTWQGRRVLSTQWADEAVRPSQSLNPAQGLSWFLLPEWTRYGIDGSLIDDWRAHGVDEGFLDRVSPMIGKEYTGPGFAAALDSLFGAGRGMSTWRQATADKPVLGRRKTIGPVRGYTHDGSFGQYLVVIPESRVVVVRQIRRRADHTEQQSMMGFGELVMSLFGPPQGPARKK